MNDWNQVENQLASWTPRLPSAALKRRIFRAREEQSPVVEETHLWRLLAPALALLMAVCMVSSRGTATFTPFITATTGLVANVALSQPQLASYCANGTFTEHNVWPTTTFEWTKPGRPLTPPLSRFVTNQ